MSPLPPSRLQVLLALSVLLLLAAADLEFLRPEAPPGPSEVLDDVVWPERAYRSLVAEMATDPANPLGLRHAERREARRRVQGMEEATWRILWACTRILDLLDAPRLEEFDRVHHDLRARALIFRHPMPDLTESVLASLRSRTPDGRVAAPRELPSGWDPDRDEGEAYGRWLERTHSWSQRPDEEPSEEPEPRPGRPSTDMLDVTPQEVLTVLCRIQEDPGRALAGEPASQVAGYVAMLGQASADLEQHWEALHALTTTPERTLEKQERQRARPDVEDPPVARLARTLREAARRR